MRRVSDALFVQNKLGGNVSAEWDVSPRLGPETSQFIVINGWRWMDIFHKLNCCFHLWPPKILSEGNKPSGRVEYNRKVEKSKSLKSEIHHHSYQKGGKGNNTEEGMPPPCYLVLALMFSNIYLVLIWHTIRLSHNIYGYVRVCNVMICYAMYVICY